MHWRRKWQRTPPGTEEPGGLPSMGSPRVGHDWSDLAAAAAAVPPTANKLHEGGEFCFCCPQQYLQVQKQLQAHSRCCSCLVAKLCLALCNRRDCGLPDSSAHGILQARIQVGCHFLLQGIFPTQGLNPCLLNWQADSLSLRHPGKPR